MMTKGFWLKVTAICLALFICLTAKASEGPTITQGAVQVQSRDETPVEYLPLLATEISAGLTSGNVKSVHVDVAQKFKVIIAVPEGMYMIYVVCKNGKKHDIALTTHDAIRGRTVWSGSRSEIAKLVGGEIAYRAEFACKPG